jgi:Intron-binding protein aquarius N-terminus
MQVSYLLFSINSFQSLENEAVRGQVLKLVSLPLWHALSKGRLMVRHMLVQKDVCTMPVIRLWVHIITNYHCHHQHWTW